MISFLFLLILYNELTLFSFDMILINSHSTFEIRFLRFDFNIYWYTKRSKYIFFFWFEKVLSIYFVATEII